MQEGVKTLSVSCLSVLVSKETRFTGKKKDKEDSKLLCWTQLSLPVTWMKNTQLSSLKPFASQEPRPNIVFRPWRPGKMSSSLNQKVSAAQGSG